MEVEKQGVPPEHRPWVWMSLSGASEKQREHMVNYYDAMVHMGESTSEFAHQIELVRLIACFYFYLLQCLEYGLTDVSMYFVD